MNLLQYANCPAGSLKEVIIKLSVNQGDITLRLSLRSWSESFSVSIKQKAELSSNSPTHFAFLVRPFNTLIPLRLNVKSRFAGAGFESRQTAAGLRCRSACQLGSNPALNQIKKGIRRFSAHPCFKFYGTPVEHLNILKIRCEIPIIGSRIRIPPNCGGTSLSLSLPTWFESCFEPN